MASSQRTEIFHSFSLFLEYHPTILMLNLHFPTVAPFVEVSSSHHTSIIFLPCFREVLETVDQTDLQVHTIPCSSFTKIFQSPSDPLHSPPPTPPLFSLTPHPLHLSFLHSPSPLILSPLTLHSPLSHTLFSSPLFPTPFLLHSPFLQPPPPLPREPGAQPWWWRCWRKSWS